MVERARSSMPTLESHRSSTLNDVNSRDIDNDFEMLPPLLPLLPHHHQEQEEQEKKRRRNGR